MEDHGTETIKQNQNQTYTITTDQGPLFTLGAMDSTEKSEKKVYLPKKIEALATSLVENEDLEACLTVCGTRTEFVHAAGCTAIYTVFETIKSPA
jgi:hypothetical protein